MYTFHLTMERADAVRGLARSVRPVLERFECVDPVPESWLHLTMNGLGFADEVPDDRLEAVADEVFAQYAHYASTLGVPFHPNVTVGWDASPRIAPGAPFDTGAQAYPPVWTSSPEGFEAGLRRAKRFVEARAGGYAEITINAWNEWTEGSYLLPDTVNGTRMLDAVRHVFGPRDTRIR